MKSDEELLVELRRASDNKDLVTAFWKPLTAPAVEMINSGQYWQAKSYLRNLILKCKELDPEAFQKIHKGNPYYFMGIACFMLRDVQSGVFYTDAALSEDLKIGADGIDIPKPTTRFFLLEADKSDQAGQLFTIIAHREVQRVLDVYNSLERRSPNEPKLTIEDIRNTFLIRAITPGKYTGMRTLVPAFISYFFERDILDEYFNLRPGEGTLEPFYLHLFKGCVLFESLLKANPTKPPTKSKSLEDLLDYLKGELKLVSISKIHTSFRGVLVNLPSADKSIDTAITFTGKVRNTAGHNLGWDEHIKRGQYQRLYEMIGVACLHAINCLYDNGGSSNTLD